MSSCNHEQGLGRELGAARAGLVAVARHCAVRVDFCQRFLLQASLQYCFEPLLAVSLMRGAVCPVLWLADKESKNAQISVRQRSGTRRNHSARDVEATTGFVSLQPLHRAPTRLVCFHSCSAAEAEGLVE